MNAIELLRQPATMLLVLAVVLLLLGLIQLLALRRCLDTGVRLPAVGRALACCGLLVLAVLLGAGGFALRGYRLLDAETSVDEVDAHILSPQHWRLVFTWPDGSLRHAELVGDDWRVEAVLLAGAPGSWLAGLPALYRLDRVDARTNDAAARVPPQTLVVPDAAGGFDLATLRAQFPVALAAVSAVHATGDFVPLVDSGHYRIRLARDGHLLAQPDAATARRINSPLGR
jgi:hypothetical protein